MLAAGQAEACGQGKVLEGGVMSGRLIWVSLPHAAFGLVVVSGIIRDAPPIARWAVGKDERTVAAYLRRKGAEFRAA